VTPQSSGAVGLQCLNLAHCRRPLAACSAGTGGLVTLRGSQDRCRSHPQDMCVAQNYKPPDEPASEYQTIPLEKIEDFGVHCKSYYALEVRLAALRGARSSPRQTQAWRGALLHATNRDASVRARQAPCCLHSLCPASLTLLLHIIHGNVSACVSSISVPSRGAGLRAGERAPDRARRWTTSSRRWTRCCWTRCGTSTG